MKLEEILQKMQEETMEIFIVIKPENIGYVTDFMPSSASVLILKEEPLLLSSKMDLEEAQEKSCLPVAEYKSVKDLKKRLESERKSKVFVENSMSIGFCRKLFENSTIGVTDIIERVRSTKSKEEVGKIKGAIKIAEDSFKKLDFSNLNISEDYLAAQLEYNMRVAGSVRPAFETIVASGQRSSLPHASSSSQKIESPVMIDWGAHHQNYKSDITRTLIKSEEEEEIFQIVLESQKEAIENIRPGVQASHIDKVAREVIEDYGYGDNFIHSTGHGVGLEIHEKPSLSMKSDEKLEKGMIVTVEPGVYIEGKFGIRVEDMILIKNKAQVLTRLPQKIFL
ncbi:MAG: M24 family metallopeptidase [Methanobacteriaceae archaeon]|nr:M24 family metallopeptidase [Methanobacteriaceae archaeon]